MPPSQIFISYRRDDAAGYARAVNDELSRCFGAERVFIDVDDINAGQPFSEVIQRSVADSAVLLALIGKRWQGEEGAAPRIFEAGDFVRQEVAAGLAKGLRVIPVLLDGVAMPDPAHLPPELRPLVGRNALALDNARFAADMAHLVREVGEALGEAPLAPKPHGSFAKWWLAGAVLGLAATTAFWQLRSHSADERQAPAPAARPQVNGEWRADVDYDWPGAHYRERFVFAGEGDVLHGSASFLGVARGVLESRIDGAGLSFVTRMGELTGAGSAGAEVVHRYRGRVAGDDIRFVMQTEGGSSAHVPVEFVARRVVASAPPASR
jgi:hypothetical protein